MIADPYPTSQLSLAEAASPHAQLKATQYPLNIGLNQGINRRVSAIDGGEGSLPTTPLLFVRKCRTIFIAELSMNVKPADGCATYIGAAL